MAITKGGFKGEPEERGFNSSRDGFPAGDDAEAMIKNMVGAKAMQPNGSADASRHNFSVPGSTGTPGAGNSASTGDAGAVPQTAAGSSPSETGAGRGSKIVKKYGGSGSAPSGLSAPGGNLGRNTAK